MKNILLAGLLVLSSTAFAGGQNAHQPVNPPQPPTEEEKAMLCQKFYEKTIPHYHMSDIDLHSVKQQSVATVLPETLGYVGATVVCVGILPLHIAQWFCQNHECVVDPNDTALTRFYP